MSWREPRHGATSFKGATSIVSKVWSFCTTLRDDGVSYGDYLEQLTYLIFLKMADEYSQPPYNRRVGIPVEYNWQSLKTRRGRWRKFTYDQIIARDKTSLDIFWLKDQSLTDLDNLPEPDVLATEIIDNLEAGLNSFRAIAAALQ